MQSAMCTGDGAPAFLFVTNIGGATRFKSFIDDDELQMVLIYNLAAMR